MAVHDASCEIKGWSDTPSKFLALEGRDVSWPSILLMVHSIYDQANGVPLVDHWKPALSPGLPVHTSITVLALQVQAIFMDLGCPQCSVTCELFDQQLVTRAGCALSMLRLLTKGQFVPESQRPNLPGVMELKAKLSCSVQRAMRHTATRDLISLLCPA